MFYTVIQCKVVNDRQRFMAVKEHFTAYDSALSFFNRLKNDKSSFSSFVRGSDYIETILFDAKEMLEYKKVF